MIRQKDVVNASLDNIYNEIVTLAGAVGECKASIEHAENLMLRSHNDLKEQLVEIKSKVCELEKSEIERCQRARWAWNLLQISPSNILKWVGVIVLIFIIFTTSVDTEFKKIITHFYEWVIT